MESITKYSKGDYITLERLSDELYEMKIYNDTTDILSRYYLRTGELRMIRDAITKELDND